MMKKGLLCIGNPLMVFQILTVRELNHGRLVTLGGLMAIKHIIMEKAFASTGDLNVPLRMLGIGWMFFGGFISMFIYLS